MWQNKPLVGQPRGRFGVLRLGLRDIGEGQRSHWSREAETGLRVNCGQPRKRGTKVQYNKESTLKVLADTLPSLPSECPGPPVRGPPCICGDQAANSGEVMGRCISIGLGPQAQGHRAQAAGPGWCVTTGTWSVKWQEKDKPSQTMDVTLRDGQVRAEEQDS